MARKTMDAKETRMDDATVEQLRGAALVFTATSLGSMVIAMALLALGMDYAALVLAALALGVGAPLGVLLALVAAGVAWWVERRRRAAPRL